jgi:hypothetical protein
LQKKSAIENQTSKEEEFFKLLLALPEASHLDPSTMQGA